MTDQYVRPSIRALQENKGLLDKFVYAFYMVQVHTPPDNKYSFFTIGGYHGAPFRQVFNATTCISFISINGSLYYYPHF